MCVCLMYCRAACGAQANQLYALKLLVQVSPSLIYGANNKGLRPIDFAQRDEIKQFLKVCLPTGQLFLRMQHAQCTHVHDGAY
jgi:hypothetical protein